MIQTVLGKVSRDKIQNTLAHEHIVFGKPGYIDDKDNCYKRKIAYEHAVKCIDMIKKYKVNFILDPTPIERGRDVRLLKKLSEDTDIYIVCATGFFKDEESMLALWHSLSYCTDVKKVIQKMMIKEIREGIGDTNILPGIIKVASSFKIIKPLEKVIFEVSAELSNRFHIPITTHCERGTMAKEQVNLFRQLHVDPAYIIIGHMTSNRNLSEIKDIMNQGYTVGFDQFGILSIPGIPSDKEKMENLLALLKDGYEDKIVLSHDTIFDRMGYISKSKPRYPDMIYREILPWLRENGIKETTINKITRGNLIKILDKE